MRTLIALLSISLAATACGKKQDDAPAPAKTADPTAPKAADPANAPLPAPTMPGGGPVKTTPYTGPELWTAAAGASRLDDIYQAKLAVTGTVAKVSDNPTGEYQVFVDAGGGNSIVVTYGSMGAAPATKLAAGQPIDVKNCTLTKPEGTTLTLRDCEPK